MHLVLQPRSTLLRLFLLLVPFIVLVNPLLAQVIQLPLLSRIFTEFPLYIYQLIFVLFQNIQSLLFGGVFGAFEIQNRLESLCQLSFSLPLGVSKAYYSKMVYLKRLLGKEYVTIFASVSFLIKCL